MFCINEFYAEDVDFDQALRLINNYALNASDNSLLENLEYMRDFLTARIDDEDFDYAWSYEINAYNKVVSEMSKLFK